MELSLHTHTETQKVYMATAQTRSDKFAEIIKLLEEVRATKLPGAPVINQEEEGEVSESNEVGESKENADQARLNVTALPFQPSQATSLPASRSSTPAPAQSAPVSASAQRNNFALPSRPGRTTSTRDITAGQAPNSNLPARPSALRSSTQGRNHGGMEEGEVGPDDAAARGIKRAGEDRGGRNTRRK